MNNNSLIKRALRALQRTDLTLVVVVGFLLGFGAIMIYSASSYESMVKFNGNSRYYFDKQLMSLGVAVVMMTFAYIMPETWHIGVRKNGKPIDLQIWRYGAVFLFLLSVALVFAARFSHASYEANGAHRWIMVGGVSLQPAEIAKIAAIMLTAVQIRNLMKKDERLLDSFKGMVYVLWPAALLAGELFIVTNNASSAIIVGLIAFVMLFVASKNYRFYVIIASLGVAGAAVLVYLIHTGAVQKVSFRFSRISAWLNPEADARGYGFQVLQSLYSIGSGGIMGKGLGQSVQKLGIIPEAQNDMIFSILCEELGLLGAFVVLLMYMLLIWRCMLVAQNAPTLTDSLIATGVMAHIALQVVINVAVVTNTIPNTGVTLPFISYGGSSVAFTLAEIGLVLNISRRIVYE